MIFLGCISAMLGEILYVFATMFGCFRQFHASQGCIGDRSGGQDGFDTKLQEEWSAAEALVDVCMEREQGLS